MKQGEPRAAVALLEVAAPALEDAGHDGAEWALDQLRRAQEAKKMSEAGEEGTTTPDRFFAGVSGHNTLYVFRFDDQGSGVGLPAAAFESMLEDTPHDNKMVQDGVGLTLAHGAGKTTQTIKITADVGNFGDTILQVRPETFCTLPCTLNRLDANVILVE